MKERSIGQYNFETGYLRISLWGKVPTAEALDMVENLVNLKRRELGDKQELSRSAMRKRLKKAIGALRSIAYGVETTWPNNSAREVAKQGLLDCGGEKSDIKRLKGE